MTGQLPYHSNKKATVRACPGGAMTGQLPYHPNKKATVRACPGRAMTGQLQNVFQEGTAVEGTSLPLRRKQCAASWWTSPA